MKGISPIIASVLLLLITISIVGFAALFFVSTTTDVTDNVNSTLTRTTSSINTRLSIDQITNNSSNSTIIIRNSGTVIISDIREELTLLGGDESENIPGKYFKIDNTEITAGTVVALAPGNFFKYVTNDNVCTGSYRVRVYHPGLSPASSTC